MDSKVLAIILHLVKCDLQDEDRQAWQRLRRPQPKKGIKPSQERRPKLLYLSKHSYSPLSRYDGLCF